MIVRAKKKLASFLSVEDEGSTKAGVVKFRPPPYSRAQPGDTRVEEQLSAMADEYGLSLCS